MTTPMWACMFCKHFKGPLPQAANSTCEAFYPDPIPDEFMNWANVHDHAYPGDHGIHFEANE